MDYSKIAPMMSQLWSPIAVVTSSWQGRDNGQICVSIGGASIVPDKPRVVVQIHKTNFSHGLVYGSGAMALNFPESRQFGVIKDFGLVSGRDTDKMDGVVYYHGESGSPIIKDCWGFLDCQVVNAMDGGDLTCFLADVVDGGILNPGQPMWWYRVRKIIPSEWMEEWDRKIKGEIAISRDRMDNISMTPWRSAGR